MRESKAQAAIRISLASRGDNVMWRNQSGKVTHYKGGTNCPTCHKPTLNARSYTFPYGLCNGSSDLIGITQVDLITKEDKWSSEYEEVTLGVFTGLEIKGTKGRERPEQKLYRELVNKRGGHVEVVRNIKEANDVIDKIKRLEPWMSR